MKTGQAQRLIFLDLIQGHFYPTRRVDSSLVLEVVDGDWHPITSCLRAYAHSIHLRILRGDFFFAERARLVENPSPTLLDAAHFIHTTSWNIGFNTMKFSFGGQGNATARLFFNRDQKWTFRLKCIRRDQIMLPDAASAAWYAPPSQSLVAVSASPSC